MSARKSNSLPEHNLNVNAIGLMSGTSHDGLDICLCNIKFTDNHWSYSILAGETIAYSIELKQQLLCSHDLSGLDLWKLHCNYGQWVGKQVNQFIKSKNVNISVIGSHGHTVFHAPKNGFTAQIGHGAYIAAETGIPCVCDFRSGDVARGGQGAPLVPIGDELLFNEYDFCLNLGGIANVSFNGNQGRVAYDICPVNMAINMVANHLGYEMDFNGEIAKTGEVNHALLSSLNNLNYYSIEGAKSLGREWYTQVFEKQIKKFISEPNNTLRTIYEHIAIQIAASTNHKKNGSILVTGGGAKNKFLVELIAQKNSNRVTIPQPNIIDFKEALIFALLAVLYQQKTISSLASVTGAKASSIGGCLYF